MTKYQDIVSKNTFSLIEKEIETVKEQQKRQIDKAIENVMSLDSLIPKSDKLRQSVIISD